MNANLKNCPQCGRLFSPGSRNICNRCLEKEEEEYMTVRRYVRDHPGASIFEASEETGVEEEKIMQFIRDGRLVTRGFKGVLQCEGCGKPINNGRFCDDCINERNNAIYGAARQPKPQPEPDRKPPSVGKRSERMHVRD
ncbi:Flagellar operon protein YvyF [Syntrophomonas zehnderi OL-4]|uniref:Flagellar operon protein YvyF n=1 Tax=Syntrophomonas zehnderi OL-4 TaxID=690567 RepID=A0A0E3W2P3_9FIRM|nr:TIGR03826 family flagellar region protein [Syntrophomonas zehnderi]CFX12312.1 Flagellar operon protein YvyF [Syntrophomonas zehnderi OL-4]